jgi:hypothetical protein
MNAMGTDSKENTDNASILLRFANGRMVWRIILQIETKGYSKERVEVYSQGWTVGLHRKPDAE